VLHLGGLGPLDPQAPHDCRHLTDPWRSQAIQRAITHLRGSQLEAAYLEAIEEWEASPDAAAWDKTSGDGLNA